MNKSKQTNETPSAAADKAGANKRARPPGRPSVDSIEIEWLQDESPDLSWLDQSEESMGAGWSEIAAKRKADYAAGAWSMLGCRARARVSYPFQSNIGTRLEFFTSGGLWGIESDSDRDYLASVEREQVADLAEHLGHFGIRTSTANLIKLRA